jgi:hypothetical protein
MNVKRTFATAVLAGVATLSAAAPVMADEPVLSRLLSGTNLFDHGNQTPDNSHKTNAGDGQQLSGENVTNIATITIGDTANELRTSSH